MEGSFANELYSGMLQLSSIQLNSGSISSRTDDHLGVSDNGDLWYDDGSPEGSVEKSDKISDMDREWQKRRNQFHTIGYRDGLIAGKEAAAQGGFNIGFKDSVSTGYKWGHVRGIASAVACLPDGLKEKMIEHGETRKKFQSLHEAVQSVSTTNALKLFHEDQTKKLLNQEHAEPNSSTVVLKQHSSDVSVFDDFYGQLQSLISESSMVDLTLKIDL